MEIAICVGSSCHLKGSSQVVRKLEEYIELNNLKDQIRLIGSFCIGECTHGVSVRAGKKVYSMDEENCLFVLNMILEESYAAD